MSKHLTILLDEVTLFSGPVEQYTFSETDSGSVEIKAGPMRAARGNLMEQLKAAKQNHE